MEIGIGDYRYEWIDEWAKVPDTESHRTNGRTHGVVASKDGSIYVFSGSKEDLTKNRQNLRSPTCFLLSNKLKAET